MKKVLLLSAVLSLLVILTATGCATMPTGPSVMAMPAPGKSFDEFRADDAACRQWAAQQVGSPQEAANQTTARSALAGTAIGAGIGAAIGSTTADLGSGAAIGAVSGLLLGAAVGASQGQASGWHAQRQYDISYSQCMYSKGNDVPGIRHRARYAPRPPDPEHTPPDARY